MKAKCSCAAPPCGPSKSSISNIYIAIQNRQKPAQSQINLLLQLPKTCIYLKDKQMEDKYMSFLKT